MAGARQRDGGEKAKRSAARRSRETDLSEGGDQRLLRQPPRLSEGELKGARQEEGQPWSASRTRPGLPGAPGPPVRPLARPAPPGPAARLSRTSTMPGRPTAPPPACLPCPVRSRHRPGHSFHPRAACPLPHPNSAADHDRSPPDSSLMVSGRGRLPRGPRPPRQAARGVDCESTFRSTVSSTNQQGWRGCASADLLAAIAPR